MIGSFFNSSKHIDSFSIGSDVTSNNLSDTIFSGGESIVSVSDIDVLYDDYKIPFYKGKSIKGNIREVIDIILDTL